MPEAREIPVSYHTDLVTRGAALAMLAGAATMLSIAIGLRQSLGLFQTPVVQDLGIAAADFALAIAVQNIVWGITQPFVGALVDRMFRRESGRIVAVLARSLGTGRLDLGGLGAADAVAGVARLAVSRRARRSGGLALYRGAAAGDFAPEAAGDMPCATWKFASLQNRSKAHSGSSPR